MAGMSVTEKSQGNVENPGTFLAMTESKKDRTLSARFADASVP
jgi:hypothetical protein